jgi:hypothetical protein
LKRVWVFSHQYPLHLQPTIDWLIL